LYARREKLPPNLTRQNPIKWLHNTCADASQAILKNTKSLRYWTHVDCFILKPCWINHIESRMPRKPKICQTLHETKEFDCKCTRNGPESASQGIRRHHEPHTCHFTCRKGSWAWGADEILETNDEKCELAKLTQELLLGQMMSMTPFVVTTASIYRRMINRYLIYVLPPI